MALLLIGTVLVKLGLLFALNAVFLGAPISPREMLIHLVLVEIPGIILATACGVLVGVIRACRHEMWLNRKAQSHLSGSDD
jgi:hypothetical protein